MGVSLTTVEALRAAKHDAVHLRDEGLIRLPDPKIAAKAAAVNPRLFRVIDDCATELANGAVVIVEDEGFRVRRLPIRP
jgi:hypothetical protein